MFDGSIDAEFLRISRATSKIEDLSHTCQQSLMKRIKFSLIKTIQRHQEIYIEFIKSTEEVMQAIGF